MTPDQPSDPPLLRVELPGGPASYTDVGTGPVVVAVHGLPGSARDWRWLGAVLESEVRLIRVEMPGFGATPLSTQPSARVDRRADFVAEVIEALALDRPLVLGHSMGGAVVTSLAVRHPQRLRALGLLASVGHRPHRMVRRFPPAVSSALLRIPGLPSLMRGVVRRGYESTGFKHTTHEQRVHGIHCVAAVDFAKNAAHLAAVQVPTLVAWTEDDRLVERAISEELYWRVPAGPRIRFPDGGHNLQKTRAVELGEAVVAWCAQLWAEDGAAKLD